MKIGISTGFADRMGIDIFHAINLVSKTPLKTLELWSLFYGKQPHFNWTSYEEVKRIENLLNKYEMEVYSIHGPFSYDYEFATEEKKYLSTLLEDTKQIIRVAVELGAKCVVIHPVSKPNTSKQHITQNEYEHKFALVKSSLEELIEFIIKNNYPIKLAIENQLPHIMFAHFEEIISLINMFNNKKILGICLDTSHAEMTYNGTDKFLQNFVSIENYVITTHFSDTDGKTDEHLIPGKGKIQWYKFDSVINGLKSNKIPVILEILTFLTNTSPEDTMNIAYKNIKLLLKDWW